MLFEIATDIQEISSAGESPFELCFEFNCDLPYAIFGEKTASAQCTNCWMPFVDAYARMTHQSQVHGWNNVANFY